MYHKIYTRRNMYFKLQKNDAFFSFGRKEATLVSLERLLKDKT